MLDSQARHSRAFFGLSLWGIRQVADEISRKGEVESDIVVSIMASLNVRTNYHYFDTRKARAKSVLDWGLSSL
jgi:hypothetical protein